MIQLENTIIVYKSISGNVKNFISKLPIESFEIDNDNIYDYNHNGKFLLIAPTYDDFMMEDVFDFMEDNHEQCSGIIGSGNNNFGELYIFTSKNLSEKYNIPIVYDFENNGNKKDVENVRNMIQELNNNKE